MKKILAVPAFVVAAAVAGGLVLAGCSDSSEPAKPSAQQQAQHQAAVRQNYIPKNDVEGKNYNKRLEIADQPSTILWCTTSIGSSPSSPLVTVPIVGKLTSGGKRPYATQVVRQYASGGSYTPEIAGPDGFFGSSGDYRYGFRPDDVYAEFYGTPTYCTTEPTVFQREKTFIDLSINTELSKATAAAEAKLKAGDLKGAQALLESATK